MLQYSISANSRVLKTASVWFLKTIVNVQFSLGEAKNVFSALTKWCARLRTFICFTGKRIVSRSLFVYSVAEPIKAHVDVSIYECPMTQIYAETWEVDKKAVLPRLDTSIQNTTKNSRKIHRDGKNPASRTGVESPPRDSLKHLRLRLNQVAYWNDQIG